MRVAFAPLISCVVAACMSALLVMQAGGSSKQVVIAFAIGFLKDAQAIYQIGPIVQNGVSSSTKQN